MQTIKSFKLLFIALVVCSNVFSQSNIYKPFPEGSAVWSMSKQSMSGLSYYQYKTSGDTLIGAYTYKKVLYAYNTTPGPFNFSPFTFNFAYRNDSTNKKLYYLDVTGGLNKDTLWYDFNLNIGDTVKSTYSYGRYILNKDRVVQSIDSVSICGKYHKRFKFNCTDNESALVEGAGFMDNFVHSERDNDCPFEPVWVYSTGLSTCYFTNIKDNVKENTIKISPNPVSSELNISTSFQVTGYTIVNNFGSVILEGNLLSAESINVSSLADGLYIIKLEDKSGNQYQSKFIKQ